MGRTFPGQTRERVFKLVRDRLLAGAPPTVREVQQAFGFRSVQTAREHLETLIAEGRLSKDKGKARGYRLPAGRRQGLPTLLVPLLGRVPAGSLDTAVEDEATVKRLRMRGRRIELHPANPDYEPIVPRPADVTLLGKVIEVRRNLEGK